MNTAPGTLCLVFLLGLAGCAQLEWQKPDTDPAQSARQTDADLEQCEQRAMLAARRHSSIGTQIPTVIGSRSGPVTVMMPAFNAAPDPGVQQTFLSDCMRAKGYRLVRQHLEQGNPGVPSHPLPARKRE